MGNKSPKKNSEEQKSNSSVLNLSLDSNKEQNQDSLINDNISDIINELKNKVKIPIENEYLDSSEIILEGKKEELKIKFLFENNEDENFINEGLFNKKSKTFVPKISIKNTPKPQLLEPNEYISPLKLSIKSFGNIQKWHKKPNSVLYDFQKNLIDCKSCNDEDSLDNFFLFNAETERNTPNQEDLHDLLNCRKKMTIFRNSLNERICKEFENILNSDYLFDDESNINNHQKKSIFWNKYIKQQQLKDKNKNFAHSKRIHSVSLIKRFDSDDLVEEDSKDNGLFILGILEKAANEKKVRNTVNA
jgi:hypothetical protein